MPYTDYDDPMSYGMDMPDQGGMFGTSDDSRLMQLIRLHNIFNPDASTGVDTSIGRTNDMLPINTTRSQPGGNEPVSPTGTDVNSNNIGSYQDIMDLYHPSTKYEDRMGQMLDQMPVRNNPGIGRKIMASIAGMGGIGNADSILYAPYYNQLNDWKTQFDPIAKAAADETRDNSNLRQIATSAISERQRDKAINNQIQRTTNQSDQFGQKQDLAERRFAEKQKVDEARAKGGVFQKDDAGNAYMVYKDGSRTQVDMNLLDFQTKQDIIQKRQVAVAGEGAKASAIAKKENERHRIVKGTIEDPDNPGKSIEGSWDLDADGGAKFTPGKIAGTDKPTPAPVRPIAVGTKDNAALIRQREIDAAQQYMATHPDARSYIKVDKNGVQVTKPGYIFGPNEQQYKDMQTSIFGDGNPNFKPPSVFKKADNANAQVPNTPNQNANAPKAETPPHPGMVRARNKSNPKRMAWVDPAQSDQWSGEWELVK